MTRGISIGLYVSQPSAPDNGFRGWGEGGGGG